MEKILKSCICFLLLAVIQLPTALQSAAATIPQQDLVVKGVVVDAENNPVVGAYIVEKGTNNGAMADSNGQFTISVKAGASLEITCIGYATKTVAASGQMTITLSQDNLFP